MTRIKAKKTVPIKTVSKKGITQKANCVIASKGKTVAFKAYAKQTATFIRAGRAAVANAVRASKALGLSITYMEKECFIANSPMEPKVY